MRAFIASLLIAPGSALAAWPEDVTPSGMADHDGTRIVDSELLGTDYAQLIRELGVTIAARAIAPPETLGASGFEIVFDTPMSFIDVRQVGGEPSPWERAHIDEDPGSFAYTPGLTLRKGLPFSLEVGFTGRWMGNSRQGVFGGSIRAALVEGYKPFPDVTLHLGYTGYVGNDELELGVLDAGVTIGSTFAVGPGEGARNVRLTPYLDVTLLSISSVPILEGSVAGAIGATAFSRPQRNPDPASIAQDSSQVLPQFSGGFQVVGGKIVFRVSGGYALRGTATIAGAIGFVY